MSTIGFPGEPHLPMGEIAHNATPTTPQYLMDSGQSATNWDSPTDAATTFGAVPQNSMSFPHTTPTDRQRRGLPPQEAIDPPEKKPTSPDIFYVRAEHPLVQAAEAGATIVLDAAKTVANSVNKLVTGDSKDPYNIEQYQRHLDALAMVSARFADDSTSNIVAFHDPTSKPAGQQA